jgi:hypothetical protein
MRNVFFNSKKAEEERIEREKLEKERKEERDYLSMLSNDERFQKYILKRFDDTISLLDTIQNLPEKNKDIEVQIRKGVIKSLTDIKESIIN